MKIVIEIKKVEKLSKKEIDLMNQYRRMEYGREEVIDFKKEDQNANFFFVKDNGKIMAFGMLKPVTISYMGKKYSILGMGRGLAAKKGMEYGRLLNAARIYYLKKTGKTAIAFTSRKNLGFFEKAGFKTHKNMIRRFRYKNPKTGEVVRDNSGDGVYYEGKDNIVSKILSTKKPAYTNVPFW